ncbi:hypothetical protein AHA02nite_24170 [Alkalibacillus haloalkaliphilus]|uniref:Uncharacterized protein n=1 Tax=Alkalibacillus haloalkaliphilus TaxID=94136 RepID=A0A511W7D2_9BACI|nr:hypothetical protein AHA02nite_24170 [Alkalibacillus haloalkaliphilus]
MLMFSRNSAFAGFQGVFVGKVKFSPDYSENRRNIEIFAGLSPGFADNPDNGIANYLELKSRHERTFCYIIRVSLIEKETDR